MVEGIEKNQNSTNRFSMSACCYVTEAEKVPGGKLAYVKEELQQERDMWLLTYRINWIKKMMCYRHWFAVFQGWGRKKKNTHCNYVKQALMESKTMESVGRIRL